MEQNMKKKLIKRCILFVIYCIRCVYEFINIFYSALSEDTELLISIIFCHLYITKRHTSHNHVTVI